MASPQPPTSRGPKRSDRRPAGTCSAAWLTKSAVVKRPTTASPTPYECETCWATAPTFDTFQPGVNAMAIPAATARTRTHASLCGAAAAPVRARLAPVAAELHRAPRRRAVRRVVVEAPAAVAARLQPPPAAVEHRHERDRHHLVQRVDAAQAGQPVAAERDLESRRRLVDDRDRPAVRGPTVVREHERAQRLAQLSGPLLLPAQPLLAEPVGQPLATVLHVGAVDQQLHPPQRFRCGLRHVVAETHGCTSA